MTVSGGPVASFALDETDPFAHYARLREGPPVEVRMRGGTTNWVVTRYGDVRAVMLDDRRFSADSADFAEALRRNGYEGPPPQYLLDSDDLVTAASRDMNATTDEEHRRLRRLIGWAFSPKRVDGYHSLIQQTVDEALDAIGDHDEVDVVGDFARPVALRVISTVLGLPAGEAMGLEVPPRAPKAIRETRRFLLRHVDRTRVGLRAGLEAGEQPDILSALLVVRDEDGNGLTDREILDMLELLFLAGEAPAKVLANGLLALFRFPDQLDLLRARPELIGSAVEEILRLEGSEEHSRQRVALEDVQIGGVTIPRWSLVRVFMHAANRDPAAYVDADRMDIARTIQHHVAFGRGIHVCLGAPLARLELKIALGSLIERFPTLSLACAVDDVHWDIHGAVGDERAIIALPVRLASQMVGGS